MKEYIISDIMSFNNLFDRDREMLDDRLRLKPGFCDEGLCVFKYTNMNLRKSYLVYKKTVYDTNFYYFKDGLLHNDDGEAEKFIDPDGVVTHALYALDGLIMPKSEWERLRAKSGVYCKRCSMFNEYGVSNQTDGGYICYNCR